LGRPTSKPAKVSAISVVGSMLLPERGKEKKTLLTFTKKGILSEMMDY